MSKAKGGLGKGFGALLGESLFSEDDTGGGVSTLPMTLIEPNREQPRKMFEPESMRELTRSIAMHGVVTPITVRKTDGEYYQIIAGERRWRAARSAGLTEIPALVIEADDKTVMELALIENLQRQDLHYMEEAAQADRVLVMSRGRIVMEGTPEQVFSQTERLHGYHLDVPQAAELRDELVKAGIPMPENVITPDACAEELYKLLK